MHTRSSLLVLFAVVALTVPRPANAKMSLAHAATAICHCEGLGYDEEDALVEAGGRAVGPLIHAIASFRAAAGDEDICVHHAYELAVELLCGDQLLASGGRVTPAIAPVRAALASSDWKQVSIALDILAGLKPPPRTSTQRLRPCDGAGPIVESAAADLGRLLDRTRGPRRAQVLQTIERLQLGRAAGPAVPSLVRLLEDRELRDRAALLLRTIGPPAAAAAPRLGRLLANAEDLHGESIYASAIAAIEAPSPAAAATLPRRLDEAEATVDTAPRRFVTLFAAAVAAWPANHARADWNTALVSRAQSALARIGAISPAAWPERDLIVTLARLPRTPELVALLESAMSHPTASIDRRFWAAWALRSLGAPLGSASATIQAQLIGPPARPLPPAPEPSSPIGSLTAAEAFAGINTVRPKVSACYARDKVAAVASVKLEIAYGQVVSATVTGKLAGTPTAACIESAVRRAAFPLAERFVTTVPFSAN